MENKHNILAKTRASIDAACAPWAANGPRRRRGPVRYWYPLLLPTNIDKMDAMKLSAAC